MVSSIDEQRLAVLAESEMATQAIRTGHQRTPEGEHGEPIFTTSSYVFANAEEAAARFNGDVEGNVYSRYTNPTVRIFEQRIAAMEAGEAAVATSSGMAAILSCCMALLESGDEIICSKSVFGTTTVMLQKFLGKLGVSTHFVEATDIAQWQAAINDNTRLLILETPSNPICDVLDIVKMADLAHANNALLMVDNCFCTPALQQPLKLGADIVVHSATKYLDGQGRCLGGVAVGKQELMNEVLGFVRSAGPTMSPFNAWVFLKGLETLNIRMRAHCENANALAHWLAEHELVEKIHYAGLATHPGHELAKQQQTGFGGVLSFCVKGGQEQAWQFINATRLMSITANLGDVKTTIVHPATTTHGRLSDEQKAATGIEPSLIRIAVGLESIDDLKADCQRGFDALAAHA